MTIKKAKASVTPMDLDGFIWDIDKSESKDDLMRVAHRVCKTICVTA